MGAYVTIGEDIFVEPVNICAYNGNRAREHGDCRFSKQPKNNRPAAKSYDKDNQYRYWFRRFDNVRLEFYRAKRNKRKLLAAEPLRYGAAAGAGATAAAIGLTAATAGAAAGVGAAGAGVAYVSKKGWRWGRVGAAKGGKKRVIQLGEILQNTLGKGVRAERRDFNSMGKGLCQDLERMRFWINKRRISRLCYLVRMILEDYKQIGSANQKKRRIAKCNAFRLTNGELRRCLEEINKFNIVLNWVEDKHLNQVFSAATVKGQLSDADPEEVANRIVRMYREQFAIDYDTQNLRSYWPTYMGALSTGAHHMENGFAIFAGVDVILNGLTQKRAKKDLLTDAVKQFLFDEAAIAPTEAILTAGKDFGFAEAFVEGADGWAALGIGTVFALVEALATQLMEYFNLKMEIDFYRQTRPEIFDKSKIKNLKREQEQANRNYEKFIIALRTMLKDGGMFEEMINQFRSLYKKAGEYSKSPQNLDSFIDGYATYLKYAGYRKVYNEYLKAIERVILAVNNEQLIVGKRPRLRRQTTIRRRSPSRKLSEPRRPQPRQTVQEGGPEVKIWECPLCDFQASGPMKHGGCSWRDP